MQALRLTGFAAAFAAAAALPSQAQSWVDGSQVDEVATLARGYGTASAETSSNGAPMIVGEANGLSYRIFFQNCTDDADCRDIRFYSVFIGNKPTLEMMNEWNRDKRWGKAYADSDLDAVIEWDVNLVHGVAPQNLDDSIRIWTTILDQYATFIGAR